MFNGGGGFFVYGGGCGFCLMVVASFFFFFFFGFHFICFVLNWDFSAFFMISSWFVMLVCFLFDDNVVG